MASLVKLKRICPHMFVVNVIWAHIHPYLDAGQRLEHKQSMLNWIGDLGWPRWSLLCMKVPSGQRFEWWRVGLWCQCVSCMSQKRRWILQSMWVWLKHLRCFILRVGNFYQKSMVVKALGGEGMWCSWCRVELGLVKMLGSYHCSVLIPYFLCLFICLSVGGIRCLAKRAFVVDSLVACVNSSRIHGRLGLPIWPDMPTARAYPSSALCFDSCESECARQDPKERFENGLDGRSISARRIRILQASWSTLRCIFVVLTSHNSCAWIRWRRRARPWKHLVRRGCRFPSWSLEGLSGSLSCFQQQMHVTWSKRSLGSMNLWRWMDALWCRTVWLAKSIEIWSLRVVAYPFVSGVHVNGLLGECFVQFNFGIKVCSLLEENNIASAKQKEAWKMVTLNRFGWTGWCPNA